MVDHPPASSPERATITVDGEGWFQAVSPSFLALIGRPVEALSGLNLIDLVHPHDAAGARHLLAAIAASDSAEASRELRLFSAGDSWRSARVEVRSLGDGQLVLDAALLHSTPSQSSTVATPGGASLPGAAASAGLASASDDVALPGATPAAVDMPATIASAGGSLAATGASQANSAGGDATALATTLVDPSPPDASERHQTTASSVPGAHVAEQRAAVRESLGGSQSQMIEIASSGHTSFVGGDWGVLTATDAVGQQAFESVLTESTNVADIDAAIGRALESAQSSVVGVTTAIGDRFLHVRPIPSPHVADEQHVVVAVSEHAELPIADLSRIATTPTAAALTLATATAATATATALTNDTPVPASTSTPTVPTPKQGVPLPAASAAQPGAAPSGVAQQAQGTPRTAASALADRLAAVTGWMERRGLSGGQLAAALGVVLVALVLRTWDLAELPRGFHGDEAITGQEAQRVLDHGSIGVYTGSALGQPTAPFYLYSIGVALFGPTIWGTRIIAALGGVLAVTATYLMVQRRFDHRTAVASSLVLAMMTWSIHFSRIAFGLAWWPLVLLLAIAAIDRATQEVTWRNWLIAGAWSTFGIYVYNSHIGFGIAVIGFMLVWLASRVVRDDDFKASSYVPILGGLGGAFVVGLPMLAYAQGGNGFSNHFTHVGRTSESTTPGWDNFGLGEKISNVTGWYLDSWGHLLSTSPEGVDGVDASGIVPQIPRIILVLAVVGAVVALFRYRTSFMALVLITVVVMPLLPAITFQGNTRRGYAMAPCIAILAGIGAVGLYSFVAAKISARSASFVAVGLTIIMFFSSVLPYFTTFRNDTRQEWIFAQELTASVDAVQQAAEDGPVFVNWFSGRHYYGYETLAYLLEGVPGANRTPLEDGFIAEPTLELTDGITSDQLYVFVGDYASQLDRLRTLYPEGRVVVDSPDPRIVAYEVPAR